MRLESDEIVEQRLNHVAPFVLMPRRADVDIVEGDSLGGSLLDLVFDEKRSRRPPLPLVSGAPFVLWNRFQRVSAA